jgi:radical SAM protein with 4Fe4S-binding SPASM domain
MLEVLVNSPTLVGLLVSLHGAHASSHQAFSRVTGSFDETVANVQRAIAAGIPVALSTVLHRSNLGELDEIVSLAQSLGADHVVFNRYLGSAIPEITISPTRLKQATQAIDTMRERGRPVTFGNCVPQCFTSSSSTGCLAGVAFCAIDPWGNLRPCNHSPILAGNLLNGTLKQVWQSPEMASFRAAIPDACHTCAAFSTCHGGCRALAMELGLSKDPLMAGPLDEYAPPPVRMGRNWRPLRRFQTRDESFGLVLIRGNAVFAVRPEASALLDLLDGTHTLDELESSFGDVGTSLIGELFRRNMIEIK